MDPSRSGLLSGSHEVESVGIMIHNIPSFLLILLPTSRSKHDRILPRGEAIVDFVPVVVQVLIFVNYLKLNRPPMVGLDYF